MRRLTKREIRKARLGADLLAKDTFKAISGRENFAITYACEAVGFGSLADKLFKFYNPPCARVLFGTPQVWGDLPYGRGYTEQSQLQRQLMLELFAHLKGTV